MLRWGVIAWALLFGFGGRQAICQSGSAGSDPTPIGRTWDLGRTPGEPEDPHKRDGSIDDPAILAYFQQFVGRLLSAAGAPPARVQLTRSRDRYASLLSDRVLHISIGLLDRIENEAELAGLIAHRLAHGRSSRDTCVLASALASTWPGDQRERERESTGAAVKILKFAGYDPAGVLDLLSKLAYEHPLWAKAIAPEDVLDLRVRLEREPVPETGYRLDSSDFIQVHSTVKAILGRSAEEAVMATETALLPTR